MNAPANTKIIYTAQQLADMQAPGAAMNALKAQEIAHMNANHGKRLRAEMTWRLGYKIERVECLALHDRIFLWEAYPVSDSRGEDTFNTDYDGNFLDMAQ